MTDFVNDTIFALSSAPGRAGVSVFRLSGPKLDEVLCAITKSKLPTPRVATLRNLYNETGVIDAPLVLWFPAPKSFTGEDCAELQVHGSAAVIEATASALLALGLRQALPGEFTRRAVENGKMDLTEAEGLADLIDAETEGQRRQAIRQMSGGLRAIYENWREQLLDAMAQIEGEIDFADEEDVPDALSHASHPMLSAVLKEMSQALKHVESGRAVRNGIEIAILGAPNAGKSTLMNQLARRDVVITSPEAGTTRDIVEVTLNLSGLPVTLLDTAGLRDTDNAIEAEGVKRAKARGKSADLRIFVDRPFLGDDVSFSDISPSGHDIIYINKTKGYDKNTASVLWEKQIYGDALTGDGIDKLVAYLEEVVTAEFSLRGEAGLTRQRHKDCVERSVASVEMAMNHLGDTPELSSENIRSALSAIEELAGQSDIEQVFDRIFSRFCIGK